MIFNTVISGSGGGAVVQAKAVNSTSSATEDDKVILMPTDIIQSGENPVTGYTSFANQHSNFMFFPGPRLDLTQAQGYCASSYEGSTEFSGYFTGTWNSSRDDFASTSSSSFTIYSISYKDEVPFAAQLTFGNDNNQKVASVGFYQNGQYTQAETTSNSNIRGKAFTYIDKHVVAQYNGRIAIGTITGSDGNYSFAWNKTNFYGYGAVFPVKYNNTWYYHVDGHIRTFENPDTNVYTLTYPWNSSTYNVGDYSLIDDDVDYIFVIDYAQTNSGFYRINKNNSDWTVTKLSQPTNLISAAIQGGIGTRKANDSIFCDMQTKDYGDYVDIIMATSEFGYDANGNGNKIAHFKFTKSTETLERLADVLFDVDQSDFDYTRVCNYQVNWGTGYISVSLTNSSGSRRIGLFVKKMDNLAGYYKYYAFPNEKGNYYPDKSITGFVKSNDGTDMFGNTVLSVSTTEDPNYEWTNVGVVLGMNVTVNEGEPL